MNVKEWLLKDRKYRKDEVDSDHQFPKITTDMINNKHKFGYVHFKAHIFHQQPLINFMLDYQPILAFFTDNKVSSIFSRTTNYKIII